MVSRRRIVRIMKQEGLVSNYTVAQYKVHVDKCNESKTKNIVNREFNNQEQYKVVVSDLTDVRVGARWHYICLLIDLYNREIIGFNLNNIQIFHTDRGNEFKNRLIDDVLVAFGINQSLSMKGCPYDNAGAEATFKIIKTEFVYCNTFDSLNDLNAQLADYVNWFNNHRIHSALGYLSPYQFKNNTLKFII